MKFKKVYQLLFFIALSNLVIAQGNFYIEVTPNTEDIKFLEELEKISEKEIDSVVIFENAFVPLTRKEANENLQIKEENKNRKLSTYRIYFNTSLPFDTLTILGISRNYKEQVYPKNNKSSRLWVVPIIVYKNIIPEKDYNKLSELILELFDSYYKKYDHSTKFSSISIEINDNLKSLSTLFSWMTGPETELFENPYNSQSKIEDTQYAYKFIFNNQNIHNVRNQNFPLPEKIHFSILSKIFQDSSATYIGGRLTSNLKIIIEFDNVGVTYSNESSTKTFWTIKNSHTYKFLSKYKAFQTGMDFLFISALYNSFKYD